MDVREVKGSSTNAIFAIPNVIRGLGDGIKLPFSVTVTQIILFVICFVLSFPLALLPPLLWVVQAQGVAGGLVVHLLFPVAGAYLLSQIHPDDMNLFRYIKVRIQTWLEPKEIIRLEEVHQARFYRVEEEIPVSQKTLKKEHVNEKH